MEGTKAGAPDITKSVNTAALCYSSAALGTCRDGAEEEKWTWNGSGITSTASASNLPFPWTQRKSTKPVRRHGEKCSVFD